MIETILAKLNEENTDLDNIAIFFEDNYEINFDSQGAAMLWKGEKLQGVYTNFFTDLVDAEGIIVDEKIYKYVKYEEV